MQTPLTQNTLRNMGFTSLTPMQESMFKAVKEGKNVALLSPTGSGKTLAFLLPLLHRLKPSKAWPQAVVIHPSRELAQQSEEVFRKMKTEFTSMALCGGRSAMEAGRKLKEVKPAIVFATPGRFNDHLKRKDFDGGLITTLVIDEFDKCLELGFKEEMNRLTQALKFTKQTIFTSATQPNIVLNEEPNLLFERYAKASILDFASTANEDAPENKIDWYVTPSPIADKLETLARLLTHIGGKPAIVFVSHRESVERVANFLKQHKFACSAYHGGMEQTMRERELYCFRAGSTNILISTDLAARGLDIPEVEAVVHYHMPINEEAFTHRCGRTARWTADGSVYLIQGPTEQCPDYYPRQAQHISLDDAPISPSRPKYATIYISKGKRDKISKIDIVGFLCKKGGLTSADIGRIDIEPNYSYVAINAQKANATLKAVAGEKIKGTRILIELMKK